MSDLISRSALLEEIKSLSIVLNGKQIFSDDAKDTVLRIINEQPTAYDIDKVVEDLEKVKTINIDVGYGTIYKTIRKDAAIEIVKQGSVSDDVCEWEKQNDYPEIYSTNCGLIGVYRPKSFNCPYCGKKLKVVE